MKKWHGTIQIKSNFKREAHYITVNANSLEEALKIARVEFLGKRSKYVEIINISLTEKQG